MTHLGALSTVLADDETGTWVDLPTDVRLRALAHVAGCPSCRADVDEQRRVKARMRFAAGVPTLQAMPAGLLDSLLRLPASPQPPATLSRPAPLVHSAKQRHLVLQLDGRRATRLLAVFQHILDPRFTVVPNRQRETSCAIP